MPTCYQISAQAGTPEIKSFRGEDHTVIPLVALVQGVLEGVNSEGPEFVSAESIQKTVLGWNGRPVVIDHPQLNGSYVSANNPEVLETELVGQIFGARVEDDKLKMEAWITNASLDNESSRISDTLKRVCDGEVVELSTGFYADIRAYSGKHEGESFSGVLENIVPDHLAILSDSIGACSIEDGCGTNRVNQRFNATEPPDRVNCSCQDPSPYQAVLESLKPFTTFRDIEAGLEGILGQLYQTSWFYIVAVSEDYVVYWTGDGMFSRDYSLASNGQITLGDERTRVRPDTNFVPLQQKDSIMEELINELISNELTKFTEDDREFLSEQTEERLNTFIPNQIDDDEDEDEEDNIQDKKGTRTFDDLLANASPELKQSLEHGQRLFREHRKNLVECIKANKKNSFTIQELEAMDLSTLEKLSTMAGIESFIGKAVPRVHEDSEAIPAPPKVFEPEKKVA